MATVTRVFALSLNQSHKTDINIIMTSSPLHNANPTCHPIPSVDIPYCLHVSYNSGVIHYGDTNIVIFWWQHDDDEDRKSHDTGTVRTQQLPKTELMTSRLLARKAVLSGAKKRTPFWRHLVQPPFLVLSSVFHWSWPHPFRIRGHQIPSSTSCDKHSISY